MHTCKAVERITSSYNSLHLVTACGVTTPDLLPLIVACNTYTLHVLMSERVPSVLLLSPCNRGYPGKIVTSMTMSFDAGPSHYLGILLHCMACRCGLAPLCT